MATHTELHDRDIAAIAQAFALGAVRSFGALAGGTINSNYRVTTERGAFVIRINEGKSRADIDYEARLVRALTEAGVPAPRPLLSRAGQSIHERTGLLVSAFPWAAGAHVRAAEIGPLHARALGASLGQLHRAGIPLARSFARAGIYTFEHIVQRFERLRGSGDPALAPALATLADELAWVRAHRAEQARVASPFTGVIHGDLFPDNVLFHGLEGTSAAAPRISALLDFEQAATGSLAYDLGVSINAWCAVEGDVETGVGYRFDRERTRALLAGYLPALAAVSQAAGTPASQFLAAVAIETRAAAARFTVTRITDVYLRGLAKPDKDFRHFLHRVRALRALPSRDWLANLLDDGLADLLLGV